MAGAAAVQDHADACAVGAGDGLKYSGHCGVAHEHTSPPRRGELVTLAEGLGINHHRIRSTIVKAGKRTKCMAAFQRNRSGQSLFLSLPTLLDPSRFGFASCKVPQIQQPREILMDSVKEVLTSFVESMRDRIGNPLVGAFFLSWLVWNFRLVLVLVGDGEGGWKAKLDFIDKTLMTNPSDWWIHGLLYPLAIAGLWVFAFPFLSRYILIFDKSQRIVTRKAVLKVEEKKPISEDEAMRLRLRMKDMSDSWEKERSLYLQTIETLQDKVKTISDIPLATEAKLQKTPHATSVMRVIQEGGTDHTINVPSGLLLLDSPSATNGSRGYVDFNGFPIAWPWTVNLDEKSDVSGSIVGNLKGAVFSEEALIVLYSVRDADFFTLDSVAKNLRLNLFEVKVAVDELSALGMVHGPFGNGDRYSITAAGRMTLAWTLRLGFRFHLRDKSS